MGSGDTKQRMKQKEWKWSGVVVSTLDEQAREKILVARRY